MHGLCNEIVLLALRQYADVSVLRDRNTTRGANMPRHFRSARSESEGLLAPTHEKAGPAPQPYLGLSPHAYIRKLTVVITV